MTLDSIPRLNSALEGRYRIERRLGEGGMATVYLADDLRHERKVALKVLKPELAAVVGAERFLAEIKTTANLQHPHILPLFDSGEAEGFLFYVMPYVEGESLRERLDREHQLPVDEAVQIAAKVAAALQEAHERGVIHRDIKPANILLSKGEPLVSDFGIALALGVAGGGRLTETGLSLGTPHYMSPEQATGDLSVGATTDIYALGCVAYEMLVGEPPFTGATSQAVLGKIVTGDAPSARAGRRSVPPNVDAAIRKGLEKVPADRFLDAQSFADALRDPAFRHTDERSAGVPGRTRQWTPVAIAASTLAVMSTIALAWALLSPEPPRSVSRFPLGLPDGVGVDLSGGINLDVSPDGSSVVFTGVASGGERQLWLRPLAALTPVPIPGTADGRQPRFSPDGTAIVYSDEEGLQTVSLLGGAPRTLLSNVDLGQGGLTWASDGRIYFRIDDEGIWRVPESGEGEPERVTTRREGEGAHHVPDVLPNGRAMLFTISSAGTIAETFVLDLQTRERSRLFQGALAKYVGSGHVLYQSGDGASLMAVPFDQERLDVTGPARSVVEGIWADIPGHFAVSESGHLAYVPLEESLSVAGGPARQLVWVDRSGTEEPVDPSLEAQGFQTIALSPDDARVAITILRPPFENLWVKELPSGPLTRLTTSEEAERPVWSRDGRTIAYIHIVDGDSTARARTIRSDGSSAGATESLLRRSEASVREVVFTPDERGLLFREGAANVGDADIGFLDLETGEVNDSLWATPFNERAIDLSPDGRWLAYVSDISGRDEVYVRTFPAPDTARWQVSTDGGGEPLWAHNGSELFYRERVTGFAGGSATSGSMMVATYVTDPEFEIRDRDVLFDASPYFAVDPHWRYYDVTNDDQRFLMIRSVGENTNPPIVFVQNFVETLRGEMPE